MALSICERCKGVSKCLLDIFCLEYIVSSSIYFIYLLCNIWCLICSTDPFKFMWLKWYTCNSLSSSNRKCQTFLSVSYFAMPWLRLRSVVVPLYGFNDSHGSIDKFSWEWRTCNWHIFRLFKGHWYCWPCNIVDKNASLWYQRQCLKMVWELSQQS